FLKDRRTVLALAGAAVALLAGLLIAWALVAQHSGETAPPPPASRGGLVIDSSNAPAGKMDAAKPLRCFVAGQPVGDMTLAECAQALFAGGCERAGDAAYGRWGQQTLRLVPGRIEVSSDNRSFHTLMEQPGCPAPAGD